MNRYTNTKKMIDVTGNRYYASTSYPEIKKTSDDIYIIVSKKDRLDLLAYQYYGDSTLWWIIAQANQLLIPSLVIGKNQQIRIPDPNLKSKYITDLEELNKV